MPWSCTHHTWTTQLLCSVIRCYKGISLVSKYTPMEVIFNGDLLVMKIKITYLILSPLVICYFRLILIFDLDHFLGDLPYLWLRPPYPCSPRPPRLAMPSFPLPRFMLYECDGDEVYGCPYLCSNSQTKNFQKRHRYTGPEFNICTWLGEVCSYCCQSSLPRPAWVLQTLISGPVVLLGWILRTLSRQGVLTQPTGLVLVYASATNPGSGNF